MSSHLSPSMKAPVSEAETKPVKKLDVPEEHRQTLLDKPQIVTIITHEIMPIDWHKPGTGYKTEFIFDRRQITELIRKWNSFEKIPIEDIRKVFRAIDIFNAIVHGDYGP